MIYSRSQSSSILISFVLSLLAVATQPLPIQVPRSLNNVVPIKTSTHLKLSERHPSLMKRAVGGIHMSSVSVVENGRLDVVRRAIGTVADSACGPASAIHIASTLKKRSDPPTAGEVKSIDLPSGGTATSVVDELEAAHLFPILIKRSESPPRIAERSMPPTSSQSVPGKPVTAEKWRQRAWK